MISRILISNSLSRWWRKGIYKKTLFYTFITKGIQSSSFILKIRYFLFSFHYFWKTRFAQTVSKITLHSKKNQDCLLCSWLFFPQTAKKDPKVQFFVRTPRHIAGKSELLLGSWLRLLESAAEMSRFAIETRSRGHFVAGAGLQMFVRTAMCRRPGSSARLLVDAEELVSGSLVVDIGAGERRRTIIRAISEGDTRHHGFTTDIQCGESNSGNRSCQVQEFLHGFTPCPPQGTVCLCFTSRNLKT